MTPDALARLAVAPELVILRLVDHTLDAMLLALRVAHPCVADPTVPSTTPTLRRARALARAARRLRRAVASYRIALDAATSARDADFDDLPF